MGTTTLAIERFPTVLGTLPTTEERRWRALQVAGFAPRGRQGGGKGSAHLLALDLAYYMMALAGPQPSDGPNAVRLLRSMPYRGMQPTRDDVAAPLPTFEDQLAHWIDKVAQPYRKGMQWDDVALATFRSWQMQLCLDPLHAIINVDTNAGATVIAYAGDPTPPPGLRRFVVVSGDVLLAAGQLLADTFVQQAALEATMFLDATKPSRNPAHEMKNAGPVGAGPTSSLADQPSANSADDVSPDKPLVSAMTLSKQGRSSSKRSRLVKSI